jgi:hypothetical protein
VAQQENVTAGCSKRPSSTKKVEVQAKVEIKRV